MADNAELHGKILGFLMGEWARKEDRQLTRVDLLYRPGGGFKDEEIRSWVRADSPELFADFINIEKLVSQIVEIAEGEADAKPAGKHLFVLRSVQHMGNRPSVSFALSPHYTGGDETALVSSGAPSSRGGSEVAVAQVLASNNSQLMRTNQQMFDGTIRVLGQQTMNLHQQVSELTAENALLRRELEEARSNKMDREFQIAMAAEKNARTNAGFQKLLQIGAVITSKIGGSNENQPASQSPLGMLIGEFYNSLRPDQMGVLMQSLDMAQKMMFMEIVNAVRPPEPKGDGKPGQQGAPNGTPPG